MKGKVVHIDNLSFRGLIEDCSIVLDDGKNSFTPMQMILLSLAACTAMDIWYIMKKKRQDLKNLEVEVEGERVIEYPQVFKKIILEYIFNGDVNEKSCQQAIDLSIQKYCSVSNMLKHSIKIETSYRIV